MTTPRRVYRLHAAECREWFELLAFCQSARRARRALRELAAVECVEASLAYRLACAGVG